MNYKIIQGDCREALKQIDADSVHTCVTSPPYFGLRSYFETGVRLKPNLTEEQVTMILSELDRLGIKPIC
jgi:site-specific DNA-methyltransferase (adenine-specific)